MNIVIPYSEPQVEMAYSSNSKSRAPMKMTRRCCCTGHRFVTCRRTKCLRCGWKGQHCRCTIRFALSLFGSTRRFRQDSLHRFQQCPDVSLETHRYSSTSWNCRCFCFSSNTKVDKHWYFFLTDNSLIFLSDSVGVTEPMQCQFNGVARQLKFKATNAKGRQMMKGANKSSSARVTPVISTPMPELKSAKHFLRKLFPKPVLQATCCQIRWNSRR